MKAHQFPNDGYVIGNLNEELFDNLLIEALSCENNNPVYTALRSTDGSETCSHYEVSEKNTNDLSDFLISYVEFFIENFNYLSQNATLTSDSPLVFGKPWFNIQRPNEYLPLHMHDGILSYSIWLKLPEESNFRFSYSTATGRFSDFGVKLTPKDIGTFVLFPSVLPHAVYPYKSDNSNETRISLSGNIFYQGISELMENSN